MKIGSDQVISNNFNWSLSINNLTMKFGSSKALDDVSLEFNPGNIYGVVGHNGAGKSTLLQILSGALVPSEGEIFMDNQKLEFNGPQDALAAGIACVYQELSLPLNLPVYQCLYLGHEFTKGLFTNKKKMKEESNKLCKLVGLDIDVNVILGTLSVAQRQLLEIAAALGRDTKVLLLDEPTTALEPAQVEILFKIIKKLAKEQNLIILFVDHKLDEVLSVCDNVTALTDGKVILNSKASEISLTQLADAVIGTNQKIVEGKVIKDEKVPTTNVQIKYIELKNVVAQGLVNISFSVDKGEILGIYGLNGSGRSRLLKLLYGDLKIDSGELIFDDKVMKFESPHDAFYQGVAYLSEERKRDGFIPLMNSEENVTLSILRIFKRYKFLLNHRNIKSFAEASLKNLSVRGNLKGPIARLSGGNQQKVLFAKVLAQKPKIILLDEPTKGIDIGAKREIYKIIKDAARNEKITILVVSSEEEEILTLSDNVLVMKSGKVIGDKIKAEGLSITDLRRAALKSTEGVSSGR
jgi:ribose transport system ATP-binding protein